MNTESQAHTNNKIQCFLFNVKLLLGIFLPMGSSLSKINLYHILITSIIISFPLNLQFLVVLVQRLSDWSLCGTICKFDYYTVYSVYQIINKEEKKTNRLTLVLLRAPAQHPSDPDTVIYHQSIFMFRELTLLCGQG